MKTVTLNFASALAMLLLVSIGSASASTSQFDSRYEKWEVFLAPQFSTSKLLQFENGAEADINERSSLGFGFGYNINRHIELTLLFAASNGNYNGTRIADDGANTPERFSANLYTSKLDFGFTYNLFKSAFTPYISANIGSTYIDSGIPTGNIGSACWWDPWWGYVCGPYAQTFTSTEFNYGAGVGLRYDFNRKVYIKGGVAKNYLDISSSNTADFDSYQVFIGIMF